MGMMDAAAWTSQGPAEAAKRDGSKGWWRVVWCHERCHKQENEARCQAIRGDVEEMGASLVCLKKATQFTLWIKRTPRPPYVLITDWREAQPCVQAILQPAGAVSRPVFTVVLCESQRQLARASEWAQGLPAEVGSVLTCERSDIPASLLGGAVCRHFGAPGGPEEAGADSPAAAGAAAAGGAASPCAPKGPLLVGCGEEPPPGGGGGGFGGAPGGGVHGAAALRAGAAPGEVALAAGAPLPVKLYRKQDGMLAIRTYSDDWDVAGGLRAYAGF